MNPQQQQPQPQPTQPQPFPHSNDPQDHRTARVGNDLPVMQPGEQVVATVTRHPLGIIAVYVASGVMLVVAAVLAFVLLPGLVSSSASKDQFMQIGAVALIILIAITALYTLIATKVYWGNRWIVTSDSITQVNQTGLFTRNSSQLSLGNIEDVSAEQNGILTHVFNYGVLKVETAGEHSKFQFVYCPNPNYYAQQILAAREAFSQTHGGHNAPGAFAPPAYPQGVNTNTGT